MRHRRAPSTTAKRSHDVAAARDPCPSLSSSPKPASEREKMFSRARKELDQDNAELCDAYALQIRNEAKDEKQRRGPYGRARCSPSIFVGLLIWAAIGLVVYIKVDYTDMKKGADPLSMANDTELSSLPDGCRDHQCLQDNGGELFGAVLGAHNGVLAYSNCHSETCISLINHHMEIPLPPAARTALDSPHAMTRLMKTGMKWQCVEYARRYWMLRGTPTPSVFGSVEGAADIWDNITHVTLLDNTTTVPLLKFQNGARLSHGGSAPRVGDLLIYPRDTKGLFPYGHVAVVVGVEMNSTVEATEAYMDTMASAPQPHQRRGLVYVAEQNWDSVRWPAPYHNYSRSLPLVVVVSAEGHPLQYTIEDSFHGIQGWARYDHVS
ncbi:hypothetical protein JKF63_02316 [Porcisia hertigi]|uniref:Peptidase C51 domain-containing protein n=1 Tax=Porcisia hertigi TaxID=2761500 RepID=A0A836L1K6_9TRYP|nr:hypothetical protein JKF63_02316 [Porcisia hertigi]